MFKITVLLLLCAAVIGAEMPDMFKGCIRNPDHHVVPGKCTLAPRRALRGKTSLRRYAHRLLKNPVFQPPMGPNLNTVLRITRAGLLVTDPPRGSVVRVEFATVLSNCKRSVSYSGKKCRPVGDKANGLCQAKFLLQYGLRLLQRAWCTPL
ncbi:uncharacterized protein LOC125946812 [Dermacentor silvarum]|uniref:uncharacterized protein LOC125946812 n=1 Tax=Dermacentor silvarum TaxID=543639 RepID=UPI002101CEF9|nr:uncharacterized protein LOC125946812 [Dermacentor silvarum]